MSISSHSSFEKVTISDRNHLIQNIAGLAPYVVGQEDVIHDDDIDDEADSRDVSNSGADDEVDYFITKITDYLPPNGRLRINLDLDHGFIVVLPQLICDKKVWLLSDENSQSGSSNPDDRILGLALMVIRHFLFSQHMRTTSLMPDLMVLAVRFTSDLLDFLIDGVPSLMRIASVYYTDRFRSVMIRRKLTCQVNCRAGSLRDLLECHFEFDSDLSPEDWTELLRQIRQPDAIRFHYLSGRGFIDLHAEKVQETLHFLQRFGITREDLAKKVKIIHNYDMPYAADILEKAQKQSAIEVAGIGPEQIRERFSQLRPMNGQPPQTLQADLRPYQADGCRWLQLIYASQTGGILADDMGLGKTIQTIALLLSILEQRKSVQALLVVPVSLVDNWLQEIRRFAPILKVTVITGNVATRRSLIDQAADSQVLISTYGQVVNDIGQYIHQKYDLLVLDEAQRIKNHQAKTTLEICKIKACCKIALTGTPIENNLAELWSIFHWAVPNLLGSFHAFRTKYMNEQEHREELQQRIQPFILRRLKRDVLSDLPEKVETTIRIELTDKQKSLYLACRELAIQELAKNDRLFQVLAQLTRLRQICCHPGMFLPEYTEQTGKLEALLDIVGDLQSEGRRVLIFSQFTTMLDIIGKALSDDQIDSLRLDGQMTRQQRQNVLREFDQGSATAFLISLRAGSVGLNLTAADTVIHFDPWWNPSVEDQAAARAHRIGQTRAVQIIYLVAAGTIEETINRIKQDKRELFDAIIQPDDNKAISLDANQIRQLLLTDYYAEKRDAL